MKASMPACGTLRHAFLFAAAKCCYTVENK